MLSRINRLLSALLNAPMTRQIALLERKPVATLSDMEQAGHILGRYMIAGDHNALA